MNLRSQSGLFLFYRTTDTTYNNLPVKESQPMLLFLATVFVFDDYTWDFNSFLFTALKAGL